jgi:4-amino-4-deoxy-L-arabinose transferase-like glycosyltransferase
MLAKRGWVLVFIGIAGFYLWGLGSLPLVGPDEPRYAEVAREMYARHDLITPTLGGLPWFEKPPLLYWLMMASYRLLGVSEFAARLGPALCGLLTAVFIFWIGKTIETRGASPAGADKAVDQSTHELGHFSALIWLSSLGALVFSRGASFDIVVTLTVTAALACFFVWHVRYRSRSDSDGAADNTRESVGQRFLLLAFYLFIGLSFLAKGLIGFVIPFGVIAIYFLIRRERPDSRFFKSLVWGVPLSITVAAVWFGPMVSRHGWVFIDQFIIQHHFARFVTNKYHHPGPIYFYVPVLVALVLPWTIFLGASFLSSRRWAWRGETSVDRLRVFAFAWVIVPVLFFSFSGSKLTAYILPVLPGVALLVGERITCFVRARRGDKVLRLTGALFLGLAGVGGWYLGRNFGLTSHCIAGAALPLVVVSTAALVHPQMRKTLVVLVAAAMLITAAIALKCAVPEIARKESVRDLLAAASARGYGAVSVVQMHTVERSAEFYATGRMSYGLDGEPVKLEGVIQVAEAARRNGGLVLCFVPLEYQSQLTSYKDAQTEVIANNGRVALISVRLK